jgi:D-3-phosphoglycerate dehydrogenase / 2-oxoglutarate reductase
MFTIKTLNNVSKNGLSRFPTASYTIDNEAATPHAILLRSADMHSAVVPDSVLAMGRAGAGTNNIPVAELSKRGVVVFNTPGANANAVRELVLAGMLMAARNLGRAMDFVSKLDSSAADLDKRVEDGKKSFVGSELRGKVLGVIGLGAIGVRVANAARSLGMRVVGFDPHMTIEGAWKLSSEVERAASLQDLYSKVDYLTVHVPLNDATRGTVGKAAFKAMKHDAVLLNFSREAIVDEEALLEALNEGKLRYYVCDFPTAHVIGHSKVIALPHLGASTEEAEENCAVMVADQVRDYLDRGNITNAVNFPNLNLPREGAVRICVANRNKPGMIGQLSHVLGTAELNILQMQNASRGELAYNVLDVEQQVGESVLQALRQIDGILSVRVIV